MIQAKKAIVLDCKLSSVTVDVSPVVTLELDDVTSLVELRHRAVAAPGLFEVARQLAHVKVIGQTTHRRQALPRVTLLEVQVREVVTHLLPRSLLHCHWRGRASFSMAFRTPSVPLFK